jgi:hypothetical protein
MHQSKDRNDEGDGYERQTQAKRARRRWVVKTVAFISALQASTRALWNDPGATRYALAPGCHMSRLWRCLGAPVLASGLLML